MLQNNLSKGTFAISSGFEWSPTNSIPKNKTNIQHKHEQITNVYIN